VPALPEKGGCPARLSPICPDCPDGQGTCPDGLGQGEARAGNCSPARAGSALCAPTGGQCFDPVLPPFKRVVVQPGPYAGHHPVADRGRSGLGRGPAFADFVAGEVVAVAVGVAIRLLGVGDDGVVAVLGAHLADTGADVHGAGACEVHQLADRRASGCAAASAPYHVNAAACAIGAVGRGVLGGDGRAAVQPLGRGPADEIEHEKHPCLDLLELNCACCLPELNSAARPRDKVHGAKLVVRRGCQLHDGVRGCQTRDAVGKGQGVAVVGAAGRVHRVKLGLRVGVAQNDVANGDGVQRLAKEGRDGLAVVDCLYAATAE
jgi:hypothetical protein